MPHRPGSPEWQREYKLENTYWEKKYILWFKKSSLSGKWIWPFKTVYLERLRLPGRWQKDRLKWYRKKEFTFLLMQGKIDGLY